MGAAGLSALAMMIRFSNKSSCLKSKEAHRGINGRPLASCLTSRTKNSLYMLSDMSHDGNPTMQQHEA